MWNVLFTRFLLLLLSTAATALLFDLAFARCGHAFHDPEADDNRTILFLLSTTVASVCPPPYPAMLPAVLLLDLAVARCRHAIHDTEADGQIQPPVFATAPNAAPAATLPPLSCFIPGSESSPLCLVPP